MLFVSALFAPFAHLTRPPGDWRLQQLPDGLDAARGVLFSAVLGLAGWVVIGALIAVCTTR